MTTKHVDMNDEGICPKCGSVADREEADNGIGIQYGPYGCACGWSEWPEYDLSEGQSPVRDGGVIDPMGGWTRSPDPKPADPKQAEITLEQFEHLWNLYR